MRKLREIDNIKPIKAEIHMQNNVSKINETNSFAVLCNLMLRILLRVLPVVHITFPSLNYYIVAYINLDWPFKLLKEVPFLLHNLLIII